VLRNDAITRYRDGRTIDEPLERGRLHAAARDLFGITLPEGPFRLRLVHRRHRRCLTRLTPV